MKINEVFEPSAKAIFESLKEDKDHTFSESTLQEISESIANAKFSMQPMTTEEFNSWLDSI